MNLFQMLVRGAALLVAVGFVPAQSVQSARAEFDAVRVPIHTSDDDLGVAYGTWAAGSDYKASFHDGMTFVPYLGAEYPHNQPLSWRTLSANVGGESLLTQQPRAAQVGDWRFEYRHGGVVEAYDVLLEGLEQTFVVDELPANGDLVIRGAITSAMRAAERDAQHAALMFCDDEGRQLVRYGEAVAFDADGRRIRITTEHSDSVVTLRVPADWLRRATLPVTVDPLLSRTTVSTWGGTGTGIVGDSDVSSWDRTVMVYARAASASDYDCYGLRTDADFGNPILVWTDISASWSADQPCCAWSGVELTWVFAWRRLFSTVSPTRSGIRLHLHDYASSALSASYQAVNMPAGANDWRPDLGGCPYLATAAFPTSITSDRMMLVFQREYNVAQDFSNSSASDIHMVWLRVANGATSAVIESEQVVRGDAQHDFERPAVRQSGRNTQWAVVWQVYDNLTIAGDWDVRGAVFGVLSTSQTQPIEISTLTPSGQSIGSHQTGPRVAGVLWNVVTFAESPAGVSGKIADTAGTSLRSSAFEVDWAFATGIAQIYWEASNELRTSSVRTLEPSGLASNLRDDEHYVLTYRTVNTVLTAASFLRLGGYGRVVEGDVGSDGVITVGFGETPSPVGVCGNVLDGTWRLAYGIDGAFGQPVYGHLLGLPDVLPPTTYGTACSSVELDWYGSQYIGSRLLGLEVDANGNNSVFHFILVSTGSLDLPVVHPDVAPSCHLLVNSVAPVYLGMLTSWPFAGLRRFPIALPEQLPAMTLYFQDWVFDGVELRSTHRLRVPIAR